MLFFRLHITHSEYLKLISRTVMGIYIYFVVCMFSVYFIPICSDSVVKLIHARNRSQDRFLQDFFLKYPLLIFFTKIAKCILLESNSVSLRLVSKRIVTTAPQPTLWIIWYISCIKIWRNLCCLRILLT
jgi:hypothetical protein